MGIVGDDIACITALHFTEVDQSPFFRDVARCVRQIAHTVLEAMDSSEHIRMIPIGSLNIIRSDVKGVKTFVRCCSVSRFTVDIHVDLCRFRHESSRP